MWLDVQSSDVMMTKSWKSRSQNNSVHKFYTLTLASSCHPHQYLPLLLATCPVFQRLLGVACNVVAPPYGVQVPETVTVFKEQK